MMPGAKMPKKDTSSIFDDNNSPTTQEDNTKYSKASSIFDDLDDSSSKSTKVKSIFDDDDDFSNIKTTKSKVNSIFDDDGSDNTFLKPKAESSEDSFSLDKPMKPLDDPNLTRAKQTGRRPPTRLRKK